MDVDLAAARGYRETSSVLAVLHVRDPSLGTANLQQGICCQLFSVWGRVKNRFL